MKTIITILVLAAVAHTSVLEVKPPKKTLPPTKITQLTFTPGSVTPKWIPVRLTSNPVLGYKLRLRVFEDTKVDDSVIVIGTEVSLDEVAKPSINDVSLDSPHKLYEYEIHGANNTQIKINGIKRETPYILDVLYFGTAGEGPTSPTLGFEIKNDSSVRYVATGYVVIVNRLPAPKD